MAVKKINGFAAPYRSATLRAELEQMANRNGVLAIDGAVTSGGGNVTIPPFAVIQQGMVFSKDVATVVAIPPTIVAPYYIAVSSPTSVDVDDLLFIFAKSPRDVTDNMVLLAEYDGVECRPRELVSIDGVIDDKDNTLANLPVSSPRAGLLTSGAYDNSPGFLVDKQGRGTEFFDTLSVTPPLDDPDWSRVDRMIFRRPNDSENRIGVRKLALGSTFAPTGPLFLYGTLLASTTTVHKGVTVVVDSANSAHFFYAEGYGNLFLIKHQKYAADRTTVQVVAHTVATATTEKISAVIDSSDNVHLAFADGNHIKVVKLNSGGGVVVAAYQVDNRTTPCDRPRVAIDPFEGKLYVVYQSLLGPSNNQLFFTTRSLSGSQITAEMQVTSTLSNLINPSIFVTDDLLVYMAYEDETNGRIFYQVMDDIGVVLSTSTNIAGATDSTSFGVLVDQASRPVIQVTENKKLFILFLQIKSGIEHGLAIYDGTSAFLPDITSPTDILLSFDVVTDSFMNEQHVIATQSGKIHYATIDGTTVVQAVQVSASGGGTSAIVKDKTGSNVHIWAKPFATTFTNAGTPDTVTNIGPVAIGGFLNPLVLASNEFSMLALGLSYVPLVGDRVTIAGSVAGNNGAKIVTAVTLESIDTPSDTYKIQVSVVFASVESPAVAVTSQAATPDGNEVRFIKSVGNPTEARANRTDELDTDLLLARIATPGPVILNYVPPTGAGMNSDLLGVYGNVAVDWSMSTVDAFTMAAGLRLVDLLGNVLYTVNGGTFPMAEDDALYVLLGGATTITPIVTPIAHLPYGTKIQVLGFRKGGTFNPHLFAMAGMDTLDPGETTIIGQDLPSNIRTRLGITSDTTFGAYTSLLRLAATDTYPAALSKIDSALGDEQENRSGQFRSVGSLTWSGTQVSFTNDIILDIINTKNGTANAYTVLAAGSPISLNDGESAYISITRGTSGNVAAVLSGATPIPAQVPSTKNIFILFTRRDTNLFIPFHKQAVVAGTSFSLGVGSGGSGTGTGIGDDLDSLNFRVSTLDQFDTDPSDSTSTVDSAVGKTDATLYSAVNKSYRLSYDASKTVTGTGTAMSPISGAPSFTVKVGDLLIVGSEVRRIVTVNSQTDYVIESAFTVDPVAAACTISQAVYTKDLNAFVGDGQAPSALFSGNIASILALYQDTLTLGDIIADYGVTPHVAYSVSCDGISYSNRFTRTTAITTAAVVNPPAVGTNLFLRFFANKTSGTGAVNILGYKAFFHLETIVETGPVLDSAQCFTDGVGTEYRCQAPVVVATKTRIQLDWTYAMGINPGGPIGVLDVYLSGQLIPRFIDGSLTPGASYIEISSDTIQLDADYSASNFSVEILKRIAVVDSSAQNTLRLQNVADVIVGTQAQVDSGQATHTTFAAALAAVVDGATIQVLNGTFTENVSVAKKVNIRGRGHLSVLNGTLAYTSAAAFGTTKMLRILDNVTFAVGADAIFFTEIWIAATKTVTDLGVANYTLYITE